MTLEDKKISFPYICTTCGELHQTFNKYCERCGTFWSIELAANIDYEKKLAKRKRSTISEEEVKKCLTYSIIIIVLTFFLALLGLNYPFPTTTGIMMFLLSLIWMPVGIISLIFYFINPEVSYGMLMSRKKVKNINSRYMVIGRRILMVIMISGLCLTTFVFITTINTILPSS